MPRKTIYVNNQSSEAFKHTQYLILLQMNNEFMTAISDTRKKYDIAENDDNLSEGELDEKYRDAISSSEFERDIKAIAHKIKLEGDWTLAIAQYVIGVPAGGSLYAFDDMHRIEAEAVNDADEPHVNLKVYGRFTEDELIKASKQISHYIKKNMKYQTVSKLDSNTIMRMVMVHSLKTQKGYSFKEIATFLSKNGPTYDYSSIRRQYSDYLKYAERLF